MPVTAQTLRRLVPMTSLNDHAIEQVVGLAEELKLGRSRQIFAIGSMDDYIYYLLDGTIALLDRNEREATLTADSPQARFAFGNLKPRPSNARVKSNEAHLLRFNNKRLETLIAWEEQLNPGSSFVDDSLESGMVVAEWASEEDETLDMDWVMAMLGSKTFYQLPPENVHQLAARMVPHQVSAGEVILRQGDPGDYYYVIREGRCQVIRDGEVVNELGRLAAFGEEALVSGSPRNATIEMLTDGLLMRLSKADFEKLLVPPFIQRVSAQETKHLAKRGAILIDVRSREEFMVRRLVRSISIPLNRLRAHMKKLDKEKVYIVYCDSAIRSAAGCFLLSQQGFKAYLLSDPDIAFEQMAADA